jgi:hypothetical protein
VSYRLTKHAARADLDRLLKHAITCPLNSRETFSFCFKADTDSNSSPTAHTRCFRKDGSAPKFDCPSTSTILTLLLDLGADPNAIIVGESVMQLFLDQLIDLMDFPLGEQVANIFELFLDRRFVDVDSRTDLWHRLLVRMEGSTELVLRNTLPCIKGLFKAGLDPNTEVGPNITLTTVFLRSLAAHTGQTNQNELLHAFFRNGADVTQVYNDDSGDGWLDSVWNELLYWPTVVYSSSRTSELGIFLEHGLDPNQRLSKGDKATTIWIHLVDALDASLREAPFKRTHQQLIFQTIILCLRYGANPCVRKLQDIQEWTNGADCRLSSSELLEMQQALARELTHVESQVQSRVVFSQHGPSESPTNSAWDLSTAQSTHDSQAAHIRTAAPHDRLGQDHEHKRKRNRYR